MSQLTIYLDDNTIKKIRQRARQERRSVSEWVKHAVQSTIDSSWPQSFIESLGSLNVNDLKRPKQPSWSQDSPREEL